MKVRREPYVAASVGETSDAIERAGGDLKGVLGIGPADSFCGPMVVWAGIGFFGGAPPATASLV